jgi:hypothetical protein
VSSSSPYGTPTSNPFLPTQDRRCKEPTLLTCGGENGSWTAGGDCAGWMTFNGGGGSFQQRSSSKVHFGGGGVGGGSSSKRQIGVGGLGKVDQR